MKDEHAAARVRRRLREWVVNQGHGSRRRLARAVGAKFGGQKSASWITDILRGGPDDGGADLRLRDLDAIADAIGVPPGELVAADGNHYVEVTQSERKLLRYYRSLPQVIQHQMMAYLDFLFSAHERELHQQARDRDTKTEAARNAHRKGIA